MVSQKPAPRGRSPAGTLGPGPHAPSRIEAEDRERHVTESIAGSPVAARSGNALDLVDQGGSHRSEQSGDAKQHGVATEVGDDDRSE